MRMKDGPKQCVGRCVRFVVLGLVFLLGGLDDVAWAKQMGFQVKYIQNQARFDFVWTDILGEVRRLLFFLPMEDLRRGDAEFDVLDNAAANKAGFEAVRRVVETGGVSVPAGVKLVVQEEVNGYRLKVMGPSGLMDADRLQRITDTLRDVRDEAVDAYVRDHWYMQIGEDRIMPDHKRIAARYAPALAPMADAVLKSVPAASLRERVDWLLGFYQSIPYDKLLNRYTSNGAGFKTPYGLLLGNKGDCDTKSVALAAILRRLYPTLSLTMVYVPGHAFIGVGMQQGAKDFALRLNGKVYVLADPTGPRMLRLGEVATEALAMLEGGHFSYQEIP